MKYGPICTGTKFDMAAFFEGQPFKHPCDHPEHQRGGGVMIRIEVTSDGRLIDFWTDGDEDGFDADWCIQHDTLGTDLPEWIIMALKEAKQREREKGKA